MCLICFFLVSFLVIQGLVIEINEYVMLTFSNVLLNSEIRDCAYKSLVCNRDWGVSKNYLLVDKGLR